MGDNQTQTTQTSGSSSPAVRQTVDQLATGLGQAYGAKPASQRAFQGSLYDFVPQGIESTYNAGLGGALGEFGDIAAGKRFGENAPGFATLRSNLVDDATVAANSPFVSDGTWGSDKHREAVGRGISNTMAGLDYSNYQSDIGRQERAASMMPSLYSASMLPGQTRFASEMERFDRTNNADLNLLGRIGAINAGNASAAGTTTTQTTPTTPWWQSALGLGLAFI